MAPTEPMQNRPLTVLDAEAGFRLSSEAGWNQSVSDWRMMLETAPAVGQVDQTGDLVASALVMPYDDRIGWVAMVLTTAACQRRGLATRNLRWAIDICTEKGLVAGLDATPAGREVYRPLGFRDLWPLKRWRADRRPPAEGDVATHDFEIRPARVADLADLADLDALAFGAQRRPLLGYLRDNQPRLAWLALDRARAVGFVLARSGRLATHIGPLVADTEEVAEALLRKTLDDLAGAVSIDVPDHQAAFGRVLTKAGFAPVRPFMRMTRDGDRAAGRQGSSFAIAGPELG